MDAKETGRVQPVKVMNFPHTFVIILAMIVVALILTWVVRPVCMILSRHRPGKRSLILQRSDISKVRASILSLFRFISSSPSASELTS